MKTELEKLAGDPTARAVAADMLRAAGDEYGARLLERPHEAQWGSELTGALEEQVSLVIWALRVSERGVCGDCDKHGNQPHDARCLVAKALHHVDPVFHAYEVERAHVIAIETERVRQRSRFLVPSDDFRTAVLHEGLEAFAMENITASQAAARHAERLRSAAELLSQADPDRLTYSAPHLGVVTRPVDAIAGKKPRTTPCVHCSEWPCECDLA